MGFFDKVIKQGVSKAAKNAVSGSIQKIIEPKIERAATNAIGSATDKLASAVTPKSTQQQANYQPQAQSAGGGYGNLFGNLSTAANSFASEAAKNMKVCPKCGASAGKDVKFCPTCGAEMPSETVAQGYVCKNCGRENTVGAKFCAECGTLLPSAAAEEQAIKAKNDECLSRFGELLPEYPLWNLGGIDFDLEKCDDYVTFIVTMQSEAAAQNAVKQYRALLLQNGFRQAGEYPSIDHLYKMVSGVCYHCDTEHCFDCEACSPMFNFNIGEPTGGFNYTKPEPKKAGGIFDLFKK